MPRPEFFGAEIKIGDPGSSFEIITPDDETPISADFKSLYVNSTGTINVQGHRAGDVPATWNVFAGQFLYIRPKFLLETGSTAEIIGIRD